MEAVLKSIFSTSYVFMWVRVATPILFAALGAAVCSQAGVVNLGLEGIMLMAALAGALGSAFGGHVLWGMAAGLCIAVLISCVFAYFHLVLHADAVLCGTAINTFASGSTVLALQLILGEKGTSASMKGFSFPTIHIPLIRDIPILGEILSGHNLLTYLAFLSVFLVGILIYRTPLGLRMRAAGEMPDADESVGVSVIRIRFIAIMICGALAAFGGMYMSMGYLGFFTRDMVAGRGFIALASSAMGQATPAGTLAASLIFAFFDELSNSLQYLSIPSEFIQMMPYLATIIGLVVYSIRRINLENKRKKNAAAAH